MTATVGRSSPLTAGPTATPGTEEAVVHPLIERDGSEQERGERGGSDREQPVRMHAHSLGGRPPSLRGLRGGQPETVNSPRTLTLNSEVPLVLLDKPVQQRLQVRNQQLGQRRTL